ncbi:MAG: GNAT family N-acetyltransferase [Flavobacteriales bacterium]|nr:GNAT family N-acetyltransferase [Flavobacteriales bacterium]
MTPTWSLKRFDELTVHELHELLRLRTDVFVVEQSCPYAELDGRDPEALHLQGLLNGPLVCYARLLPPTGDEPPHIGRVVVRADHRHRGIATALMQEALRASSTVHGTSRCALAAQSYLQGFYESLGFRRVSEEYVWDGIPHIDMRRE